MKTIFNCNRGFGLYQDEATGEYIVKNQRGGVRKFTDELLAWRHCVESLDCFMTKSIGDYREKTGRDRYTGLPNVSIFDETENPAEEEEEY